MARKNAALQVCSLPLFLGCFPPQAAAPLVRPGLVHAELREIAADALLTLTAEPGAAVLAAHLSERDVATEAASVLRRHGAAGAAAFASRLGDRDSGVRLLCVDGLGRMGAGDAHCLAVAGLLADPVLTVRDAVRAARCAFELACFPQRAIAAEDPYAAASSNKPSGARGH